MKLSHPLKKSAKVLFGFTASYFLLMLIPLFIGIAGYTIALNNASRQVIRTNELALERACSEVECSIQEAKAFAVHLSAIDHVNDFLDNAWSKKEDVTRLQSTIANLPEFKDTYGLVQRYFVYSAASGYIADNRNAYMDLPKYYDSTFRYGSMSVAEFEEQMLRSKETIGLHPAVTNYYFGKKYNSMLYINFLMSPSRNTGRVVFYIDEDALIRRLRLHFGTDAEFVDIYMANGESMLSANKSQPDTVYQAIPQGSPSGSIDLTSPPYLISYCYSDILNSTLMVAVPRSYVSAQLKDMQTTMFTGMGIMLLIGIILILLVFQKNRKPLARVIDSLPDSKENQRSGLWWLQDAVDTLSQSRKEMEQSVRMQRVALQNAMTQQLVQGYGLHEEELEAQLKYVGVQLEGEWFCAVCIRMNISGEWDEDMSPQGDLRRTQLIRILSDFKPKLVYLGLQGQNTCAVVYVGNGKEELQLEVFQRLYQRLIETGEDHFIISVGSKQHSLVTLYHSFRIAEQQLERAEAGNWLLLETMSHAGRYCFTFHDEQRLSNLIINNKPDEAQAELDHLWRENFVRRNVTGFERELLFYRMADTIISASGIADLFVGEQMNLNKMNAGEFFVLMRQKIQTACQLTENSRIESSNALLEKITAYIQEHFSDYETNLASTAMHFGLTAKYLSAFFKEKTQVNFSNYLEDMRIRHAQELLKTTQMTVEEIAAAVGYSSSKSFSRAYYRCLGQTPSQSRE